MKKVESIALIEIKYFVNAIKVLDAVSKTCEVELLSCEKYLGGQLVTIIVGGTTSSIINTVETVNASFNGVSDSPLIKVLAIHNPHKEIMKFIDSDQIEDRNAESNENKINEVEDVTKSSVETIKKAEKIINESNLVIKRKEIEEETE